MNRLRAHGGLFLRAFAYGFGFWGLLIYYRTLPQSLAFIHLVFGWLFCLAAGAYLHRRFGEGWHRQQ